MNQIQTWTVEGVPHNWQKNLSYMCVRRYVLCVCMFVCVSKGSSFLSWNIYHSSWAISENKFFEIEMSRLPIHLFQYFGLGKAALSPLPKLWCLGNPKRNRQDLNAKELSNHILTHVDFFFILRVGVTV